MDGQPATPNEPVSPAVSQPTATPAVSPAPTAAPAAAAAPPLAGTPDSWPGAFGVYKYSKQAVKLNLGSVIGLWVIDIVVTLALELALKQIGRILAYIIGPLLTGALTLTYIAGVRGQRKPFGQALSEALPLWLKMIGLSILVGLSAIVSLVLLIIPFFFVFPRLVLAYYYLVDKRMGVIEAYKASWNATKGSTGKAWGIIGANVAMALLLITIIGIPFSIYFLIMYSAAFAVLYEFLNKGRPVTPAPQTQSPSAVPPTVAAPPVSPTPPPPTETPSSPAPPSSPTVQ